MFLIGENPNGYLDVHYRYYHRNGYFIGKGGDLWEEYQNNKQYSIYKRVNHDKNYYTINGECDQMKLSIYLFKNVTIYYLNVK